MYNSLTKKGFTFFFTLTMLLNLWIVNAQFKMPKFGKGLQFMAKDTTSKLKFNARIQNLFTVDYDYANEDSIIANRFDAHFMVRRARLKFGGYAF